jgi:uncharacterized RDD family membrane protein YckC
MSAKPGNTGKSFLAFAVDALFVLIPALVWLIVFGRVSCFMTDPPSAAAFRSMCLAVAVDAGIFYLASFIAVQTFLLIKRKQTIGKWILGFK